MHGHEMAVMKPGKDACSWIAEGHICYDKVFGLYPEGHKEPDIYIINIFLTLTGNNVEDRLMAGLGGGRGWKI